VFSHLGNEKYITLSSKTFSEVAVMCLPACTRPGFKHQQHTLQKEWVIKTKVVINESPTPRELILKYVIFKK
jgi:hypothetical protein